MATSQSKLILMNPTRLLACLLAALVAIRVLAEPPKPETKEEDVERAQVIALVSIGEIHEKKGIRHSDSRFPEPDVPMLIQRAEPTTERVLKGKLPEKWTLQSWGQIYDGNASRFLQSGRYILFLRKEDDVYYISKKLGFIADKVVWSYRAYKNPSKSRPQDESREWFVAYSTNMFDEVCAEIQNIVKKQSDRK